MNIPPHSTGILQSQDGNDAVAEGMWRDYSPELQLQLESVNCEEFNRNLHCVDRTVLYSVHFLLSGSIGDHAL